MHKQAVYSILQNTSTQIDSFKGRKSQFYPFNRYNKQVQYGFISFVIYFIAYQQKYLVTNLVILSHSFARFIYFPHALFVQTINQSIYFVYNYFKYQATILRMLYLQNIKFESDQNLFNVKTKKIIRFSYANKIIVSNFICAVVDQKTLAWDQVIKIPMVYEQQIDYQIINKHDFGYNPEEFTAIYNGKIFLRPNRTSGKWKVFQDTEQGKKKIGLISLNYRRQDQQINYQQNKIPTMDESIPAQILVKNLAQVPLMGYIMLYTGKKKIKSPKIYPSQNGKGEFNFKVYFSKQFMKKSKYEGVFIEFFNQQNKFIGKSVFQFQDQIKIFKARLLNSQSLRVGDSYLNLQQEQKKASYIEQNAQLMFKKFKTAQSQKNLKRGSLDLLIEQYNNTPVVSSRISEQKRSLLSSKVERKNHSIIRSNKQIVMPVSKRFEYHMDQNPSKVNYYSKLQTFDYFNNQSGKYYKGASIGKDNRFDFTRDKRDVPGVGSYRLPSQFDQF